MDMKYKAKIKGRNEWVEGFIAKECSMDEWIIFTGELEFIDGREWNIRDWEIIDISTAHLAENSEAFVSINNGVTDISHGSGDEYLINRGF